MDSEIEICSVGLPLKQAWQRSRSYSQKARVHFLGKRTPYQLSILTFVPGRLSSSISQTVEYDAFLFQKWGQKILKPSCPLSSLTVQWPPPSGPPTLHLALCALYRPVAQSGATPLFSFLSNKSVLQCRLASAWVPLLPLCWAPLQPSCCRYISLMSGIPDRVMLCTGGKEELDSSIWPFLCYTFITGHTCVLHICLGSVRIVNLLTWNLWYIGGGLIWLSKLEVQFRTK